MNEDKFFEVRCMHCGKLGLLSNGLCRHGCGTVHSLEVINE